MEVMTIPGVPRALAIVILLMFALPAGAVDIGVELGYGLSLRGTEASDGMTGDSSTTVNLFRGGLFFDADYYRIGAVGYLSVGDMYSTGKGTTPAHIVAVSGDALLKLPVVIGPVKMWSGLGARFTYNLLLDFDGDWADDRSPDEPGFTIFAVIAMGGTWQAGKIVSLGSSFALSYDALANLRDETNAHATNILFDFTIFIGFSL